MATTTICRDDFRDVDKLRGHDVQELCLPAELRSASVVNKPVLPKGQHPKEICLEATMTTMDPGVITIEP